MTAHLPLTLSHLKFRHLMLVDLLVQHGSLHKVAKHLNVSQPAATAMLNDMETLIGLRLFDRTRQGVMPTAEARAILSRCRTILSEFSELTSAITRVAGGRQVLLRVGVVPQAFIAHLPKTIGRFRETGGCALQTHEGTARQLLELLLQGKLDCVVGRLPNEGLTSEQATDLSIVNLYEDEICVVASVDNPIHNCVTITYELLAQQSWVLQQRDSSVRRAMTEAFLRRGIQPPEPVVETATYVQNLAIVSDSDLITVAPRTAAEMQQSSGRVRLLDIQLDVLPMQVCMITRKASGANTAVSLFRQAFIESLHA
jgi:DNA-binding transcriptional LysR family regulator